MQFQNMFSGMSRRNPFLATVFLAGAVFAAVGFAMLLACWAEPVEFAPILWLVFNFFKWGIVAVLVSSLLVMWAEAYAGYHRPPWWVFYPLSALLAFAACYFALIS